jgi:hypothetical protein
MNVILATQEAEIRKIIVRSQPGQIVKKTLSQNYPTQKRAGQALYHLSHSSSPTTIIK